MKILIYEDNETDLKQLLDCLQNFALKNHIKCNANICKKAEQIFKEAVDSDLVFLDVEGEDASGIDIGIKLREMNSDIKIIFITNYSKYLIDGYKASANRYFLKPIDPTFFEIELESVFNDYLMNSFGFIDEKISPLKIYIKDILYVEFTNRKTYLHLTSGKVLDTPYTLKYWSEKLSSYHFSQSYKSFLVNLRQVSGFSNNDIILNNNEKIPFSRLYKNDFEQAYYKCLRRMI